MLNAERLYQMHISPPGGHPQNCKFSLFWLTESSWKRLLRDPWTARRSKQSWVFIARTDVEAETPILWPPDVKGWLTWKDPDAGKDWGQEKGTIEDEVVGWHHQRNGHEFEWTPGVGDGQGGLACCHSWGHKESDMTERLNWTVKCFLGLYLIVIFSIIQMWYRCKLQD